eukprot:symbB.v1.2.007976.t1/scaffold465.1/size200768/12
MRQEAWPWLSVNGTNPNVLPFMKKLGQLDGMDYLGKLMELEIHGVEFKNLTSGKAVTTWPVRYCADMLLSGHTFVLVLYMLAFADLMRRITIMMSPVPRAVCRILIGLFCMACVGADLFLIVRNQFHYTVDVVMAIIMTVLVYTNVGMTAVVQWYAQEVDRRGKPIVDNGITWVPALMVPFCCFNGYYSVQEMEEQQAGNDSGVWRWLTSLFEPEASISPDQVQSYGSTENAEQKSEAFALQKKKREQIPRCSVQSPHCGCDVDNTFDKDTEALAGSNRRTAKELAAAGRTMSPYALLLWCGLGLLGVTEAVGGLGALQDATEETQKLVMALKANVWEKAKNLGQSEFGDFRAVAQRSQVVAGKNHFVKVQVGAEDYIHVKIFEFLKHERKAPILVDVELHHTKDDAIEFFPRAVDEF